MNHYNARNRNKLNFNAYKLKIEQCPKKTFLQSAINSTENKKVPSFEIVKANFLFSKITEFCNWFSNLKSIHTIKKIVKSISIKF